MSLLAYMAACGDPPLPPSAAARAAFSACSASACAAASSSSSLVSSWALAKLSTAMARKTFNRV